MKGFTPYPPFTTPAANQKAQVPLKSYRWLQKCTHPPTFGTELAFSQKLHNLMTMCRSIHNYDNAAGLYKEAFTHTHTHTHTHIHTCTHSRTHARKHARTHARMHAHGPERNGQRSRWWIRIRSLMLRVMQTV